VNILTVIAYDGKYLVADGRATIGTSLVTDNEAKIHPFTVKNMGKCVVALCGSLDVKGPLLAHLQTHGLGVALEHDIGKSVDIDMGMRGLLVTSKGHAFEFTSDGGYFQITNYAAIGSGAQIANHFLTTGHDAVTAVIEACKTELTCGGNLAIYNLTTGKFEKI
jgi:ATP-dependent protease HslVU (ClpYQ) peptidase subunit